MKRRRFRLRAAAVAAGILLVGTGCGALYRSQLLQVRRVEVVGVSHLSAAKVRALARVPSDATLIRFPADAVASRVISDPWVRSAQISRVFPDGMRIRVVERTPVAIVDVGTRFWLVDGAGFVIAEQSGEVTAAAVVVRDVDGLDPKPGRRTTSETLLNAIAVLTGLSPPLLAQVVSVSAPSVDGTTLFTRDRVEIVFGSAAESATKDALVRRIMGELRGKVVSIDVRTTDRPTWRGLR